MDYDVISNFSLDYYQNASQAITPEESMSMILHEIVFSIICLVGIVADGLIIYILNRLKNMKGATNVYIINWLISDTFYLILTPCFYRIFSALEDLFIGEEIVCVSFEMASMLQVTTIAFIGVICMNWYLDVFEVRVPSGRLYPYVILVVWLMAFSGIVTLSSLCIEFKYSLISHYLLFFGYAALMVLVLSMHWTRYVTKDRPHEMFNMNLNLVSVYVICWFPSWICLLVSVAENYSVLYYLSIVAACLGYLNPLFNLYIFARCNRNFRMCLLQIFRCINRDYYSMEQEYLEPSEDLLNRVYSVA
ncbi:PREDICTED: somatostatin receptor type 1-like [Nicrophorus vespilloides]|uniref:Somatostatin receptor type 1-like n=1 Tax=Nicrophorus vespilloides TaxID=110193 RepID=A0ABM1NBR4_NICVS|nr:PREDICTED: somatostatin receptor type 1-like [Nicrophorus vespilloides]XP_017784264.1 PREDICTED: somatostatin receptor type 1-like [Nicrophorus vespilloides]